LGRVKHRAEFKNSGSGHGLIIQLGKRPHSL
jgi:hypothetical protein